MALSSAKSLVAAVAGLLFAGFLTLAWITHGAMSELSSVHVRTLQGGVATNNLVDIRAWQSAQQLATAIVTAEEEQYARDALRLASHDADQAFAAAFREAALQPRPANPEITALTTHIEQLEQSIRDDQSHVNALVPQVPASSKPVTIPSAKPEPPPAAPTDAGASDLELAQAQLQLDKDELSDAQEDLARLSGDKRPQIQQELAAYQATLHKTGSESQAPPAATSAQRYGTLAGRIAAWSRQNDRLALIQVAIKQAQQSAITVAKLHDALQRQATTASLADLATRNARLARMQAKSAQTQLLAIDDDRIQTEQRLAAVYSKWADQVELQHRIVSHLLLRSCAIIAFVLLCIIGLDELANRLVNRPNLDRRRRQTFQVVLKLVVQLSGAAVIVFLIFGAPSQTPTILGLTTAGLTLVLQDFILAFFGWFVLMGKNGIRLGDWVEINGVAGEVVDVGLFRTALHETGNWTDKGHPTGRRVTFINSFAIKGQYFNFSTSGQWMWDEMTISVPVRTDTYELVEQIRELITKETEGNSRAAEKEWQRIAFQANPTLKGFKVEPAVDMRPTLTGVDVILRYVTQAGTRLQLKNRLYGRIISLLHREHVHPEAAPPATS